MLGVCCDTILSPSCTVRCPGVTQSLEFCCLHPLIYFIYIRMYLWWSFCTLYLFACQVRVTVGDSSLCCTCVTYFERARVRVCACARAHVLKIVMLEPLVYMPLGGILLRMYLCGVYIPCIYTHAR